MIQFSRPKKTLAMAMDPFRRREVSANEYLDKTTVPGPQTGAAGRFDATYYRTHDPLAHSLAVPLAPDAQSVVSQALTSFPAFPGGKKSYTGYASSIISQQPPDDASVVSGVPGAINGQKGISYSQYDRLPTGMPTAPGMGGPPGPKRRLSIGSMAPSDAPTASMYNYAYKAGDDDTQSIAPSQAGMTEF